MSKDAQLLLAMGMGPDERPDLWYEYCKLSCQKCGWTGIDFRDVNKPKTFYCPCCGSIPDEENELINMIKLGLDLDPSKWTVGHDAAFARVVWPWLRSTTQNSSITSAITREFKAPLTHPSDRDFAWAWWGWDCHNPGPTMCQAIYSVLCGDKTD